MGGCDFDDKDSDSSNTTTTLSTAYLVDARVANVNYFSPSSSGATGTDGSFKYNPGETITFKVGNVTLGSITNIPSDKFVTPFELVGVPRTTANLNNQAVINIARFLQSLDSDSYNYKITIPESAKLELQNVTFDMHYASKDDFEDFMSTNLGLEDNDLPSEASATSHLAGTLDMENTTPVATFSSFSVSKNSTYTGILTATDADSDPLSYYLHTQASHGIVTITNSSTGAFTYTPTTDYSGSDSFSYVAYDGEVNSTAKSVTITINSSLSSSSIAKSVNEDSALAFSSIDFSSSFSGTLTKIKIATLPTNGSLTLNGAAVCINQEIPLASLANLLYTPTPNYNGTDSFTFSSSDGTSWSSAATATITIASVDDTFIFNGATTFVVNEGSTSIATLSVSNPDGDTVTFSKYGGDDNDSFALTSDGVLSFLTAPDYKNPTDKNKNNSYQLIVAVSDGTTAVTQQLMVYINKPTNNAPTSSNQNFTVNEDINFTGELSGSDTDGDTVTYKKITSPTKGTLILDPEGNFSYLPYANLYGSDSFMFRVFDGADYSAIYEANITITPVNDSPYGSSFSYGEINSSAKTFNWVTLSGATDPDGDDFNTTSAIINGTKGVATISGQYLTYTPNSDENGSDEFNITISDNNSSSEDIEITVTVTGIDTIDANITAFYAIDENSGYTISSDQNLGIYTPSIAIKFSEEMNSSSINTTNITIEDESSNTVMGAVSYNTSTKTAYYLFDSSIMPLNDDHTYTITVANVSDKAGNVMDTNVTTFTTGKHKHILKTGQTTMYQAYDDGYFEHGSNRVYANGGIGYITGASGLMWQDAADNNESVYNWSEANTSCENNTTDFSDWRLPSSIELLELVNYGDDSWAMIDNGLNFAHTANSQYWSSDSYDATRAWAVSFSDGNITKETNTTLKYLRCVRETSTYVAPTPLLRDSDDGIVIDSGRYLMWQDDVNYTDNWSDAIDYCESLFLGGYSDWRLPNIVELATLTSLGNTPALNSAFVTYAPNGSYWSSTTNPKSTTRAYDINISDGTLGNNLKTETKYVRCVRGGN